MLINSFVARLVRERQRKEGAAFLPLFGLRSVLVGGKTETNPKLKSHFSSGMVSIFLNISLISVMY